MKFKNNTLLKNSSQDIRKILQYNMKNDIENLIDDYGYERELIEGLSYNIFVTHTEKVLWKAGKTEFTKAYNKEVNRMVDEGILDFDELGFLLYLSSKYTTMEDNYLRIDSELVGKNEIIEDYKNKSKSPISDSSLRRKFKSLEDKGFLFAEYHPDNKRKNIYFLSPFVFYKGKYMDERGKRALLETLKEIYDKLKLAESNGELNIKLNSNFEKMSDTDILEMCAKYMNSMK